MWRQRWSLWLDEMLGNGCVLCGQRATHAGWCDTHWYQIRTEVDGPRCRGCGLRSQVEGSGRRCTTCTQQPPPFIAAYVGADYASPWDTVLRDLKFARHQHHARALASALNAALPSELSLDCVVPVPAWPTRLAERGFNPPALIGRTLARCRGWRFDALGLRLQRELPIVHLLPAAQRWAALQHAFTAQRSFDGLRVGIVDDVMTTGATLQAATQAVLQAGARHVVVLAALRTPREV